MLIQGSLKALTVPFWFTLADPAKDPSPCRTVVRALGCSLPGAPSALGGRSTGAAEGGGSRRGLARRRARVTAGGPCWGHLPSSFSASDADVGRRPRPSSSRRAAVPTRNSCPSG